MSRFSTVIAEIVLVVDDVPRSAEFYEHVVGLEPVSRTGDESGRIREPGSAEPPLGEGRESSGRG